MPASRLFIASDHAGFELKETLKKNLPQIEWIDLGPMDTSRVDYPDFADRLCKSILALPKAERGRGVLICGSGQGMAMRANRYSDIRAALVWNEESTMLSREHNDANVLCMGARMIAPALAEKLVGVFLNTSFAGGRHQDRVEKLGHPPSN
jgi:ribose 5-phosphate isomerase B